MLSILTNDRKLQKEFIQLDKEDDEFWDTLFSQMLTHSKGEKEFLSQLNQLVPTNN